MNQLTKWSTTKTMLSALSLLLTFSNRSTARPVNDTTTITAFNGATIHVLSESSKRMKLIAQAQLFNLECSTGDAFRVSAGVTGDYYLPKWASLHTEYINSYFNIQKFNASTLNKGTNALKGFSLFEIGGRFHILDRKAHARHKLILSQHTDYAYGGTITTTHYLKAKFPCRRIFALRGGLYRTTAPVSTDMNKSELTVGSYGAVKTKSGTVLSNAYFTNDHTTGFYLGLCDLFNMSVRTSFNGSTYNTSLLREIYADVLVASTSFDPITTTGAAYEITPNTPGSFQASKIGWRLGKKMIFTRKTLNMGFGFEVGSRPGVAGRGTYFSTGVSLAFVK
ncbi:MAG: hypothetical protein JWQ38_807 [Flavipsychrobacter sp.]|nr:hypothetical protein [Flavipsychrobacter sp.]